MYENQSRDVMDKDKQLENLKKDLESKGNLVEVIMFVLFYLIFLQNLWSHFVVISLS